MVGKALTFRVTTSNGRSSASQYVAPKSSNTERKGALFQIPAFSLVDYSMTHLLGKKKVLFVVSESSYNSKPRGIATSEASFGIE